MSRKYSAKTSIIPEKKKYIFFLHQEGLRLEGFTAEEEQCGRKKIFLFRVETDIKMMLSDGETHV